MFAEIVVYFGFLSLHSSFFDGFFRFHPPTIQDIQIKLPLFSKQDLREIAYFFETFNELDKVRDNEEISVFSYMIFSNKISLTNLLFCIDYFHIPILVDQMLDHFIQHTDIINYKLCKSIIDVFGIDSYIAQTAFLRLTHSNSFPQVYRRLSITAFVEMDNETFDSTMSLHFEDLPSLHTFACHICWHHIWDTYHLNDCCQ